LLHSNIGNHILYIVYYNSIHNIHVLKILFTKYCKSYGIPECRRYYIVLDQFVRGPDDDSKESKHVALE
jgi:hypothetical protein